MGGEFLVVNEQLYILLLVQHDSKLLKGVNMMDYIGDNYRGY